MDRRLALVTGASAGIGAAFARILASHGYDVALTARAADRLEALAEETALRYGVETLTVAPTWPSRRRRPDPRPPDAHGRTVDCLINNAGYGLPGGFADNPLEDQRAFIQVMMTAPSELATAWSPAWSTAGSAASSTWLRCGPDPARRRPHALCRQQGLPRQVLPEPAPGTGGRGLCTSPRSVPASPGRSSTTPTAPARR
jgi:NAD(P)-dependent dehydrogenase (short-subunit alcohol dehydrogenase family)